MAGRKTTSRTTDMLVIAQGIVCMAFVFSVGINIAGLGLSTDGQCDAVIRLCIVFYMLAKIFLFVDHQTMDNTSVLMDNRTLFLLERVRIVRAPFIERKRDLVWTIGSVVTIVGYLVLMGLEFIAPESNLSSVDGDCRIGIQPGASVGVIILDSIMNLVLTGIFVRQLRPKVGSVLYQSPGQVYGSARRRRSPSISRLLNLEEHGLLSSGRTSAESNLRAMIIRNVVGSILLLLNTVVPNIVFLAWPNARLGHSCSILCLTDSKSSLQTSMTNTTNTSLQSSLAC
jgi:hypothetical protein